MIHLKPLIRDLKEYEISSNELLSNQLSSNIYIPVLIDEIDQYPIRSEKQPHITIIHPEQNWGNVEYFQPRKFLNESVRKKLTEIIGTEKTD